MPKAGRNTMNTSALAMNESQLGGIKWTSKLRMKFEQVFFRWGFIIVVIGFLLGRGKRCLLTVDLYSSLYSTENSSTARFLPSSTADAAASSL